MKVSSKEVKSAKWLLKINPTDEKNNAMEENFISIDIDLSEKTFENKKPQVIK